MVIEIAANNISSAIAAYKGGASRIELCDNLSEGGTTPSIGTIATALAEVPLPIFPIIRPRGGDFLYSNAEINTMLYDIQSCKDLGCPGIVIGALDKDGNINLTINKKLISAAGGMQITFHRAFDRCANYEIALQQLIDLGCSRVLTSGQAKNALDGITLIEKLVKLADNRIIIMPGAGVTPENALQIVKISNAKEIHASMKHLEPSIMHFKHPNFKEETFINTAQKKVNELCSVFNT